MSLTITEIKKIAELARIQLTPAQEKRHAETISDVLEYMKILDEVDTREAKPTAQVTGLQNVFRSDEPHACEFVKELILQMPKTQENELVVPGVFADQDENV